MTEDVQPKNNKYSSKTIRYTVCLLGLGLVTALGLAIAIFGMALQMQSRAPVPDVTTTTPTTVKQVCTTKQCVQIAGEMLATMDDSVDPCQDFYQYACGGFEKYDTIPAGYGLWGAFSKVELFIQEASRLLLQSAAPPGETPARSKARSYYQSCMNLEKIAEEGTLAMQKMNHDLGGLRLKTGMGVPSNWNLENAMETRNNYSLQGLFDFFVMLDPLNSERNLLWITQEGLYGLVNPIVDDRTFPGDPGYDQAAGDMYVRWAELIGITDIDRPVVNSVLTLEKEIYGITAPIDKDRSFIPDSDSKLTIPLKQMSEICDSIDWLKFLNSVFGSLPTPITITENEPVYVVRIPYFKSLNTILKTYLETEEGKQTLHNYFIFRSMFDYAPKIGGDFKSAYDDFRYEVFGISGSQPSWQRCVTDTDGTVPFGLAAMYVEEHFPETGKVQTTELVEQVSAAFSLRIGEADWMDNVTKAKALEKLEVMRNEVAYPYWLKDDSYLTKMYSTLSISESYVDNQFYRFRHKLISNLQVLRDKVDQERWAMSPTAVNAYYMFPANKFVILAGILQSPFFQLTQGKELPPVLNFGAIGMIIGHEIGHGFDDSGSLFDKDGNLASWWTLATRQIFNNKTQCMVDQYSQYNIMGFQNRGDFTLGENIADNGGLGASYYAFRDYPGEDKSMTLSGFEDHTPEQLFFLSFGQMWCTKYTEKTLASLISRDVHSPGPIRVVGSVQNSPEFSKAYNCPLGSPMNPEQKCKVW